jgi:hypothetical protein
VAIDRVLEEILHIELWPYFLATNKTKYSNLIEHEIVNDYERVLSEDLNLFRTNATIKLYNASRNVALDEFNEIQVKDNKQLPTIKLHQNEITWSQHLALMKDAQLLTELLVGSIDDYSKKKTTTSRRRLCQRQEMRQS